MKSIRAAACEIARLGTMTAHSPVRHDECNKLYHSPNPIVLSPPTDDAIQHPTEELSARVILPQDCLEELEWWDTNMSRWNGMTIVKREMDLTIDSDASQQDWGAFCKDRQNLLFGTENACQLSKTIGCHLGNPDVCKIKNRNVHPIEDRQYHHSNGLH